MIDVTQGYEDTMSTPSREWNARLTFTKGGDTLTLTSADILAGSLKVTEKVMASDELTVGGTVSATFEVNILSTSVPGTFQLYGSSCFVEYGLKVGGSYEYIPMGFFDIDEPTTGITVTNIKGFDRIMRTEKPYDTDLVYPATLGQIYADICSKCNIPTDVITFPNSTLVVDTKPQNQSYRTVLGMVMQLAGSFSRMGRDGRLYVKWFEDTDRLFHPKDRIKFESRKELIQITGVVYKDDSGEEPIEYLSGTKTYPVEISRNLLLDKNHQSVLDTILDRVNPIIMYPCSGEWVGVPEIEVGDIVGNVDGDQVEHPTPITSLTHVFGGNTSFEAKARSGMVQKIVPFTEQIVAKLYRRVFQIVGEEIPDKLQAMVDKIQGVTGGSVLTMNDEDGKPIGHIYMDTDDQATCQNYIMINNLGIAFGNNGLSNPPTTAIGVDGQVISGTGFFNSLVTNLISSSLGQSLDLSSNVAIVSKVSQGDLESAVSGLASESYVDSAIDSINRANPNLVSNRSDRWEQGNIVDGSLVASAKHIRTQSYYPIRAGSVTMKVSPLYQVALVRYSDSYGYLDTTAFATEQTINIASNQYFKAVLQRVGTDDILPSAIDTAELKVENAAEATQWTPYFGDMTLDEQRDLFVLDITSTDGWTVDTNEWTTQLQAKLYLFNEDVTSRFSGASITWFRQYPGEEKAIIGSGQTFYVTPSMTNKSATYEVVFNIPANNYYIKTKLGDRILTKGGDLILARVSDDPGITVSASKVLVRDYRDRILSTEATLSIQANQIQQKVEQSSYNADKNVIENNITTLTTKVGSVEASVNGATHTFTQTGYEFRDTKGDVIFSLTKGMANEQNLMKYDDCENGYPLIIPIHIGASTASIEQVLIKWRNSPFRATAKSAASGGGTKTSASGGGTTSGASSASTTASGGGTKTSASGGGTTSGASSASTTASGGSASVTSASGGGHTSGGGGETSRSSTVYAGAAKTTSAQYGHSVDHYHSYKDDNHYHDIYIPAHTHWVNNHAHTVSIPAHSHNMPHTHSIPAHTHSINLNHSHNMPHTHSNPNHTHTIDLNHSHNLVFGVVEQAVLSDALTIWVDGVQRGSVNASQGELDVTPYLQTTGWHIVQLRTTTLKRIDANIFVKSYIRR